jgi:hypothetical protein
MHAKSGRRNTRPRPILLDPRVRPSGADTSVPEAATPLSRDEAATAAAAAWLVKRYRVKPNLAAVVALHAGLVERHHG